MKYFSAKVTDLLRPSHQISNPFGSSTAEEKENDHDTFSFLIIQI
jgi:hypothetical protein